MQLKQKPLSLPNEYFFSSVNVASSKPSTALLPRIKISFFLLSICTNKLISAPNIIKLLPNPPKFDHGKRLCTLNIQYYSQNIYIYQDKPS